MKIINNGIVDYQDVQRLESVPLNDLDLPNSVYDAIAKGETSSEGRDALVFVPDPTKPEKTFNWSYEALLEKIEQSAHAFKRLVRDKKPVVSILLPNLPESHFALWGAQMVGAANPINPLLEPKQIAEIVSAVKANILVTLAPLPNTDLFSKALEVVELCDSNIVILTVNPANYAGRFRSIVGCLYAGLYGRKSGLDIRSFRSVTRKISDMSYKLQGGSDVGALFHTGGTTGAPKVAQLTHSNQIFVGWAASANRFMEKSKSIFCGLPLYHVNGVLVTGLVSWMNGATVILGPPQGFRTPRLIENYWRIVEQHNIGAMSAVPTVYQMLAEQPIGNSNVSSLEFGICGAASISKSTFENFQKKTGIKLLEGYGLTESSCISSINPGYGERRLGTVGYRLPYQNLKIFNDGETLTEAKLGDVGVIGITGPNVFKGYLNKEDDEKAWIDFEGKRWFNTGDLGFIDTDGYLTLTGRKKDLIIRGGHNIDPQIIESAFERDKRVKEVAAIGSPDRRVGEVPVVYLTLQNQASTSEADLLETARPFITERAAIPKNVLILEEMPLTAIGKIFKLELKLQEINRVIRNILDAEKLIESFEIQSFIHPQKGIVSEIVVEKGSSTSSRINALLEDYTFQFEIKETD